MTLEKNKLAELAKEGQFLTFKKFLKDKHEKVAQETKSKKVKSQPKVIKNETKLEKVQKLEKPQNIEEDKYELQNDENQEVHHLDEDMVKIRESKLEQSEGEDTEELDFSNNDRSFDKHPLEIEHDGKIEEDSIRMSKSTLRNIKVKKRARSTGPLGRTPVYVDTQSMAKKSLQKAKKFIHSLRLFFAKHLRHLKEWWNKDTSSEKIAKRSKSTTKQEKTKKLDISEEVEVIPFEYVTKKVESIRKPEGKTIEEIIRPSRTYGKSGQELIFEQDSSSVNEDEPSVLLKRKIDKLREDEAKLKEYEKQLEDELKRLRQSPKQEDIEQLRVEYNEKVKTKSKKGKKKKNSKKYHDMRRMKQDQIKRHLHLEPKKDKETLKPKQQYVVKEYKSDKEDDQVKSKGNYYLSDK